MEQINNHLSERGIEMLSHYENEIIRFPFAQAPEHLWSVGPDYLTNYTSLNYKGISKL